MKTCSFFAKCLEDTDRFGRVLADLLPAGTTIALTGTLGAGKTRLVQAIAAALGVPREDVVSPTFVLCQEYPGRHTLCHLDAYRLRDSDDFLRLGVEELFESQAVILIEWADRVADCLPPDRLEINIEILGETDRVFRVTSVGIRYEAVVSTLESRLATS